MIKSNVNLRADASKKADVIMRLAKGDQLTVKKVKGDWYLVGTAGGEGYVRKDMLRLGETVTVPDADSAVLPEQTGTQTPAADTADTLILGGDENVPDESGEAETTVLTDGQAMPDGQARPDGQQAEVIDEFAAPQAVMELQGWLKTLGFYSGDADGEFGAGTTAALAAFQRSYGLEPDGKYGPVSRSAIEYASANGGNGSSSSNIATVNGVVLCDWTNFMKTNITKDEPLTVVDVKTGTRFSLRPFACGFHADVEPPTKEDTQTLLAVNGGKWDWTPRPIIVNVKGVWYAAAINVMPHGPDTLPDNGMDGQICMHFFNSRQHNTGSENENMQKAIEYALENGGALAAQQQ